MTLRKTKYIFLLMVISAFISCRNKKENNNPNVIEPVVDTSASGKAISQLSEKIIANPKNPDLLYERSKLYIQERNFQYAMDDIKNALKEDSTKAPYFITLSDLYFAANKTFYAKSALEKCLTLDPENVDAHTRLAEIFFLVKKYDDATDHLNAVLRKDPDNVKVYFMSGMIYKETGDTAKAISAFQKVIDLDEKNYDSFMQLGVLYEAKKNPLSLQYYSGALKLNPQSEEALYGRGLYYQDHNDLDKAIQDYTSIVQLNPKNAHAHFNLGYIHYNNLKVYDQAIKHYNDAIAADPDYVEAYYNRGLCYEAVGDIAAAKKDYDKAISFRPNYDLALKGLERIKK
ncbi:MAG TPA: tetratricopeptide repeat protein [Bacteroidia bacterium]|nr:tetratricopeptide repeat protein [Bacteroidia bacterium]